MKKLILGALLIGSIATQTAEAGFFRNTYYRARYRICYNRGTVGLIVGSVGTALVGCIFKKQIKKYVEPVLDRVWNWVTYPFRKNKTSDG